MDPYEFGRLFFGWMMVGAIALVCLIVLFGIVVAVINIIRGD